MKLNIPFYKQDTEYTCGPTSLQMAFSFLGKFKSEHTLAREAKTNKDGTTHEGMIETALREKFYCYVNEGSSIEEIKYFIHLGFPVIIDYTEPSGEDGHYAVVSGYQDGYVVLNDPWNGKNFKISEKEFISRWHDCHPTHHMCVRWMMVLSKTEFSMGKQYVPHSN